MRSLLSTGLVAVMAMLGSMAAAPVAHAVPASAVPGAASSASLALPGATGLAGLMLLRGLSDGASPDGLAASAAAAAAPFDQFLDVSCFHPGDCLAVGDDATANGGDSSPVADLWNGHHWAALRVPLPHGAGGGYLSSISCVTGGCMAAGGYWRGSTSYPLTAFWTGNQWKGSPLPAQPPGARYAGFNWISCYSVNDCAAVGSDNPASDTSNQYSLAETWNGHSWTARKAPTPATSHTWSFLDAASCPTAKNCLFGGGYVNSSGGGALLADSWDGEHWGHPPVVSPGPTTGGYDNFVSGFSCLTLSACTGVGLAIKNTDTKSQSATGFAESGKGVPTSTGWKLEAEHNWPSAQSQLIATSCVSATFCVASGGSGPYTASNTGGKGAIAIWNGSAWSVTVFTPPKGQGALLTSVRCESATYCVAVGTEGAYDKLTAHGLTAFYNGSTWRQISTS
ncbi:MAG TPA: hypothetical protein VHZ03_33310 [Trebonia sp.]|nr:hypothetical protein [Trebonia sp.]